MRAATTRLDINAITAMVAIMAPAAITFVAW
jgi:hypothetical protein